MIHLRQLLPLVTLIAAMSAPMHGQTQRYYSPSELRERGQEFLREQVEEHGRVEDGQWRRDVKAVIDTLKKSAAYRDHPLLWELVADSALNASAAPGGVMVINLGLPLFCRDYSRASQGSAPTLRRRYTGCLAAVIGHEFGHLALGHTDSLASMIERRRDIARRQRAAGNATARISDPELMRGLRVERERELEADRAGALYALRAGWEVQDAIDLFIAMDSVARRERGWRDQLTWLEGHPRSAERAAMLEGYRAKLKLNQRDFDDALALIDNNMLPDSALALLDRVLADFPNLPAARHARASVLAGKWIAAASVRTLQVRPALPTYDARFMTSIRGATDDALAAARSAFASALSLNAHPYTLSTLAVLDAHAGDRDRAIERADRAASLMADDAEVLNNQGVVYYLAGRFRDAHRIFAAAEQAAGSALTATIAFNVARAALAAGDSASARRLLERYTSADRQSAWGREAVRLEQQLKGNSGDAAGPVDDVPLPTIAGLRLGARSGDALRALGEPEEREAGVGEMLWRYTSRGIVLLIGAEGTVEAIALTRTSPTAIQGVRVGDSAESMLKTLGKPFDRARRDATTEQLVFHRGRWVVIVATEEGKVRIVSARTVQP